MDILNVNANVNDKSYTVYFQQNIISGLRKDFVQEDVQNLVSADKKFINLLATDLEIDIHRKIAIISDDNVYLYYGHALKETLQMAGYHVHEYIFHAGESSKNMDTVMSISSYLSEQHFNRKDILLALGGGVVGDITGFVASVYMRGIDYIQIPTSLIAQVDSSIGGKTAIDTEFGKNLIGSFYNPVAVIIDTNCLKTLPKYYLKDGMGEVIKYHFIDEKLFNNEELSFNRKLFLNKELSNDNDRNFDFEKDNEINNFENFSKKYFINLFYKYANEIVKKCCVSKIKFVQEDLKDSGIRRILNFGHTIGHAIEAGFEYQYSHGVCVGIGMYMMTLLSERLGWTNWKTACHIKNIAEQWGIFDDGMLIEIAQHQDKWLNYLYTDKKNEADGINVVVLEALGKPVIKHINNDKLHENVIKILDDIIENGRTTDKKTDNDKKDNNEDKENNHDKPNKANKDNVYIYPSVDDFGGEIIAPPSKSMGHRLLIAASLSGQNIIVENMSLSDDIRATMTVLEKLGVRFDVLKKLKSSHENMSKNMSISEPVSEPMISDISSNANVNIEVDGSKFLANILNSQHHDAHSILLDNDSVSTDMQINNIQDDIQDDMQAITLFCAESGSTLRFLIPIALLLGKKVIFDGAGRLNKRPLDPYFEVFKNSGISYDVLDETNYLPLSLSGRLKAGKYHISGDVSSQFITGLLMSLVMCDGDSEIILTTELESKPYVHMSMDVLQHFGIVIEHDNFRRFIIKGNQNYICNHGIVNQRFSNQKFSDNHEMSSELKFSPDNLCVTNEADYSQMAFWAVAGAISKSPVKIIGATKNTSQGDIVIFDILEKMNVLVDWVEDGVVVYPMDVTAQKNNNKVEISVKNCPDLVPILVVLATAFNMEMHIVDAGRLRIKESDRLHAIATELNAIGANITECDDGLIIRGIYDEKNGCRLKGGRVYSHGDHRIVMSLAVAGIICERPLIIEGASCVNKSYPTFFEDYNLLGGKARKG